MLDDAALAPDPARQAAVASAWAQLIGPGVELSAAERRGVIRDARAAWAGAKSPNRVSGVLGELAHWVAVDVEGLRLSWVADFERRGLDRWSYLEVVGVVARLANIDFYVAGIGASEVPLPPVIVARPSGRRHPEAQITNTWVPTVGRPGAAEMLDALPGEGQALRELLEAMYLPMAIVDDAADAVDGSTDGADALTRPQVEYLAARTSYLNECFY